MKNKYIIDCFLSIKENQKLYQLYKEFPTKDNEKKLDNAFRNYFRKIRAISYLNKVIHFESKHFDKIFRRNNERYLLILDRPINTEENISVMSELLEDYSSNNFVDEIYSEHLEDHFHSLDVINSIKNLTEKQKRILFMYFIKNLKDAEIAKVLKISQQAVSKTRNKAITKIRSDLIA